MHRAYFISIFATREPMRRDSPKVRSGLSRIYGAAIFSEIDVIDLVLPAFDGRDWPVELFSFANYRWESKCGGRREPVVPRGGIHPQQYFLLIWKIELFLFSIIERHLASRSSRELQSSPGAADGL